VIKKRDNKKTQASTPRIQVQETPLKGEKKKKAWVGEVWGEIWEEEAALGGEGNQIRKHGQGGGG